MCVQTESNDANEHHKIAHKVNIKRRLNDVTSGDESGDVPSLAFIVSSSRHSKLKKLSFLGNTVWQCAATANQSWESPNVNDIPTAQMLPEFTEQTLSQTEPSKQLSLCVNTVELLQHHRIILWTQTPKFSNISGTSTTDNVQKGWLNIILCPLNSWSRTLAVSVNSVTHRQVRAACRSKTWLLYVSVGSVSLCMSFSVYDSMEEGSQTDGQVRTGLLYKSYTHTHTHTHTQMKTRSILR